MIVIDRIKYILECRANQKGTTVEVVKSARDEALRLKRAETPEEFATAVEYLVSRTASYITGESLAPAHKYVGFLRPVSDDQSCLFNS